ncbi:polysaccharide deacetylase family protein [Aminipila terrae]|uniref:Polysaccharide deacetylase family protein n=1 Tax=Aminipila terrae TaxID=2697030 RepID=A0A6P1MGY9_9FIRM|nr:polysaccharide deacetylase family protein [Aminipila terrae]QHI73011.1 polysaccharide deacetylase family protein [Aminipila terrae]
MESGACSRKSVPAISKTTENKVVKSAVQKEKAATDTAICDKITENDGKVVYLTFDDGSSPNTPQILDILRENKIKATFFFNTSESQTADSIIKEAYDDGHAVGVLTSTGTNYDTIYSSVDNYVKDFEQSYNRIQRVTGKAPSILRFPGGSINAYDKDRYKDLIKEVVRRGMVYFDWNVCADDGSGKMSKESMITNATKLPKKADECIVLMHDNGNDNTCEALNEIIRFYKDNGYSFKKLTANVKPITF